MSSTRSCCSHTDSIDVYRGKSFHYAGDWTNGQLYSNDEYQVDFVTYDGKLWACYRSHQADAYNMPVVGSSYWRIAVDAVQGIQGEKGEKGDQGEQGIQGEKGEKGDQGERGERGSDGRDGRDGRDGEQGIQGEKGDKGDTGEKGERGEKGEKGDPGIVEDPIDFLIRAYKETPGKRVEDSSNPGTFINMHLSDEEFLKAFGNISPIHGFEIREVASVEALGIPTSDKVGYLYLVPSEKGETGDLFDEWVVISSGETAYGEETYKWEKWGTAGINLSDYYTKDEVVKVIETELENWDGGVVDSSEWV